MGEPLKIERIEDMSRLLWLEHVITEASMMTLSIKLLNAYELDVFSIAGLGATLPPQLKTDSPRAVLRVLCPPGPS